MKKKLIANVVRSAIGATALCFGIGAANAQSPADFYRGKTVTVIVGYGPGGGYDIYSRLLARHLGNHIPGGPNVIVQNMPGAAGVVASNNIYVASPKDGTVIAAVDQNIPMFQLLGGKGVKYDATRFAWLGSMAASNGIAMAWAGTGINALDDAKARKSPWARPAQMMTRTFMRARSTRCSARGFGPFRAMRAQAM